MARVTRAAPGWTPGGGADDFENATHRRRSRRHRVSAPQRTSPLQHAILVWAVLRYRLTDIPELDHAVTLEAEDMNHGRSRVAWILLNVGVYRHEIPVLESMLNFQHFARILGCVFFHRGHERVPVTPEERIVVPEVRAHICVVGLPHLAGGGEAQKRYRSFLPRMGAGMDGGFHRQTWGVPSSASARP